MKKGNKKILCLDFDGVIHSYVSGWKGARVIPDPPVPGAMEFLSQAVIEFDVVIHSSRCRYWFAKRAMRKWLWHWMCQHFIEPLDPESHSLHTGYECSCCKVMDSIRFSTVKPPAHLTIDDRAVTFNGYWPKLDTIRDFMPWNLREDTPEDMAYRAEGLEALTRRYGTMKTLLTGLEE